ncbi:AAA domain-containing protein [Jhaorihella thermophila]
MPGPGRATSTAQNVNLAEVAAITREVQDLLQNKGYEGTVGVIAPFRPQVHALTQALRQALPDACWARADLRVGTVDGFQGQERDLILFSPTVHDGAAPSAVTFLVREWRRMNVAISRARAVAHVFGDLDYARSGKVGQLRSLAARATEPRGRSGEDVFESGWERIVFHALKARGLDPQPQYEIAGRRLDFALFGANGVKLDLEIDGRRWHQDADGNRKIDDHWRDHQMRALGWKVRRFWVDELKQDMEGCLDLVERDLKD